MKIQSLALSCALLCTSLPSLAERPQSAPPDRLLNLSFTTRVDWQQLLHDGDTDDAGSGFKGQYFMLRVDGSLADGLIDYSWRQRLNRPTSTSSMFDQTDWVYVRANLGEWHLSAGKEVVKIGGWEYDRNPVDLYSSSLFWNNIPCFQLGATVARGLGKNDMLAAQVTQSPFKTPEHNNLYSYNLMWTGSHGIFQPIWSANMVEYLPSHYISYLALGNRFALGRWTMEADVMNRATASQRGFFFRDYTLVAEISWQPADAWRFHVKATRDYNHSGSDADYTVYDGTDLNMAGAGVEWTPFNKRLHCLRLHANVYYSWGTNTNGADAMQNRSTMVSIGAKWHINLLSLK